MSNPFNPIEWLKTAQNWFAQTERSSGFRPYLIFLLLHAGLSLLLLFLFPGNETILVFVINSLCWSGGVFLILFCLKAFQDPNFCRSEKHIETVKRIEVMEQKGGRGPIPIVPAEVSVISNPSKPQLPPPSTAEPA